MAKILCKLGFGESHEDPNEPGVWVNSPEEIKVYGDLIKNSRRLDYGSSFNGRIIVENKISVIAPTQIVDSFHDIEYVEFKGIKWTVTAIEASFPRLTLTLGARYNG